MLMMNQLTHRGLANLSKVYGGLLHMKMGGLHLVVVSTPEMAREVLQVQDSVFANRPARVAIKYLTYDRADMAFAQYGPSWRQMRKICVMKLFSRKRAESWASVREEVDSTLQSIAKRGGSAVNIGELALDLTKNITYRAAFGSNFIPWLGWIQGKEFNKRLVKARGSLDEFIDKIIDDHIEKRKKQNNSGDESESEAELDMVDELMEFYSEDVAAEDLNSSIKFTRDNIKAIIMDVMFGGTETVASAIEWAMAELMKSPDDLKKLQQELIDVVGLNRRLHESDLEKLTYLKCCIKETLRLHPPIPVLLHETSEASVVAGYSVPARSDVMINAWAINRDKTAWEDPETFKPERFLKKDAPDFKGSHFEFIPFGSGRRSCPGMQLGLYGLDLAVAHLVHCFSWELPDGMKASDLDMSDLFGLTAPRAIQLVAVPTYRLQCPLLE
ncbi:Cytochrome P450 84A1 [Vitis vinifera]|uniref:Cytochrome P450 84A1 n=1 Tax=Vitis vinifera TaxID=29760 RepID=A0A438I9A1_VITVI|nr:Cytochrome P450 84A1 [Vitis vinifera]